jgi:hypothetical protein
MWAMMQKFLMLVMGTYRTRPHRNCYFQLNFRAGKFQTSYSVAAPNAQCLVALRKGGRRYLLEAVLAGVGGGGGRRGGEAENAAAGGGGEKARAGGGGEGDGRSAAT